MSVFSREMRKTIVRKRKISVSASARTSDALYLLGIEDGKTF
jgi:hypothetical protein